MKIKYTKKALASAIALSLMSVTYSGSTLAVGYDLCAKQGTETMSDGAEIPMWGFVQAQSSADFANNCALGTFSVPGPALTVPVGDNTLTINVKNVDLPEPVSIVIPGQNGTTMIPVSTDGTPMLPVVPGNNPLRVRSFTHETAQGATEVYSWTNVQAGTYAYQSGTHPALQIQMGLYGAMTKSIVDVDENPSNPVQGQSYSGAALHDSETTVFYSEIDPVLHNQVANMVTAGSGNTGPYATTSAYGTTGMTSTINYNPQYFLVNGDDSSTGTPIVGAPGQTTLMRFINMGLQTHIPTLHGDDFAVLAEDGHAYTYARNQYSVMVAAGQTRDALFTPQNTGDYVMFDRVLSLTNKTPPIVTAAAGDTLTSPGSLVTILQVGTNADTDNVLDHKDNCLGLANPSQLDTDNDGYGNTCDADLNNDGIVNGLDLPLFIQAYIASSQLVDFNEDGYVNGLDLPYLINLFYKEPGPSGTVN